MDKFLADVESYAARAGLSPSTVAQLAANVSGSRWALWRSGKASPTARTMDRILEWIESHPVAPVAPVAPVSPAVIP